jgi:retron-type reverse transcriptase
VVDADLSKYFDTIPHDGLLQCGARRIVDRQILALIKMWLKTPVEGKDRDGTRRISGGKGSTTGTPQGGVISPLLANLYINRFLKQWARLQRVLRQTYSRRTRRAAPYAQRQHHTSVGLAVNPAGEPCAGNPHARFDERGEEPGCRPIGP